jgi:prepilin-type processing-associated H-X9-DG protein
VKTYLDTKRHNAMTLIEVLAVMLAVMLIVVVVLPEFLPSNHMSRAPRIQCVNNLKQIDLAAQVWEGDNNDKFPPQVPGTNGGTMEFTTGPNVWRHFQVMSNELSTPKVLLCPAETDQDRFRATNFVNFCNSNVSFFVGVDVTNETNPAMILSGDHNITNGTPVRNGLLELTTNRLAGWTSEMHNKVGNVALADGSVRQISIVGLQNAIANTGLATNRLQMPILAP